MAKRVTDMQLQLARERGAQASRPPLELKVPELVELMEKFQAMKAEHAAKHEANFEKKLAKMDEIVKAIQEAASSSKATDLGPVLKMLAKIQSDHVKIAAEHLKLKMRKENEHDDDDDEPCAYKLTGKRDQRGLIDLEYGLTFTPIDE